MFFKLILMIFFKIASYEKMVGDDREYTHWAARLYL